MGLALAKAPQLSSNIDPLPGIAHRSVTDDFDFGCASSIGQHLTVAIISDVHPPRLVAVVSGGIGVCSIQ